VMESMYQETPSAYTWIGKVHPLSLQYSFGVVKIIPRWRLSAAAATCKREESRAWYQVMESMYQETPSAYTWIGKVHLLSLQYSFGSSETNSKMAAVCCCCHV
jgi:hypothetical protein